MADFMFRDLKPQEIECRVQSVKENGFSLLLYKDARCDMGILDETVGAFNWQRGHSRDNKNCTVSIWDTGKLLWVHKEDVGTESNTEATKGLASDSFKRACFNWGVGRELYTAPFIWINNKAYIRKSGNKFTVYERFTVGAITIADKYITSVTIHDSKGKVVYSFGKGAPAVSAPAPPLTRPQFTDKLMLALEECTDIQNLGAVWNDKWFQAELKTLPAELIATVETCKDNRKKQLEEGA